MYADMENSNGSRLHPDRALLFPPYPFLCEFIGVSNPLNLYMNIISLHCDGIFESKTGCVFAMTGKCF